MTRLLRAVGAALVVGLLLSLMGGCGFSSPAARPDPPARSAAAFVDVASSAGLRYRWNLPAKRLVTILYTLGNGCAFLDYDRDGNLDILLVGPHPALFRGDGRGQFTDVTRQTGLDKASGFFTGCAVGDWNNDGWDDFYLSGYRTGLLLQNMGGKTFQDVTRAVGLTPQPWGTSCTFCDFDGDGFLDLYVAAYVRFGPDVKPQFCQLGPELSSCPPDYYKPLKGALFHNDAGRGFTDITPSSGALTATGKGLGVAAADFNGSGRPSLAVANDEMPGDLLCPRSGPALRLENLGAASGTAYDRNGGVQGGMGVDWGDYDNDGRLDLIVATFQDQARSLYRYRGDSLFQEVSGQTGLVEPGLPYVAFGCKFLDYDNDGSLDLIFANGDVQGYHARHPGWNERQPTQLLRNRGGPSASFEDVSAAAGADLQKRIVGRGLCVGDYDNDGRVDVLIVDAEGSPLLLHNQDKMPSHWLGLKLVGTRSNKDGYGAVVTATVGARTLLRQCQSDGSYLSASDARVHLGLGTVTQIDTLRVKWPSGKTDTFHDLPADRYITLTEGRTQ